MRAKLEIDEKQLRKLVLDYFREKLNVVHLAEKDIRIEVKSAQNYRSEWESAEFRARYGGEL